MKKITYFYIGSAIIFLSLMSNTALAWKNGLKLTGTSTGTIGSDPIIIYKNDYTEDIETNTLRKHYGTHDWIAESALELLYDKLNRPSSGFLYQLWNEYNPDNLRYYYLFGTEMPDRRLPSGLTTRCNFDFQSIQFHRSGHESLRFYDDSQYLKDDKACQSAQHIYDEILKAFNKKDCQAAAVFIGALIHVISDATFFYHVLDNTDTYYYSWHVLHVTFRTWKDANQDRSNEFFNLAEATGKLTAVDMFNPYQATLLAGKNTRFGSLLYQDAEFLLYSDPNDINRQFWADIDGYWTDYPQEHDWTHSNRPSQQGTSVKKYFDTVEHNLNQAVYYCATVLNYILNFAGYTSCDCGSGSYPNPPSSDGGSKDDLKEGIKVSVDQVTGLFFFNFIGLMATALAIALLNKIDVLEALIPVN